MRRYETNKDIVRVLQQRGSDVTLNQVIATMEQQGLLPPFDEKDLEELAGALPLSAGRRDRRRTRLESYLRSPEWVRTVKAARLRLGIGRDGLSISQSRQLHGALMRVIGGERLRVRFGERYSCLVQEFWLYTVWEARGLSVRVQMNPTELDDYWKSFASGRRNFLLGVGKLMDPEAEFHVDGVGLSIEPGEGDRLIGHLLWGLPFGADNVSFAPKGSATWHRGPGGSSKVEARVTNIERATPREIGQAGVYARLLKNRLRRDALAYFSVEGTWVERWKVWNRRLPDFAYPSAEALRKAVAYEKRKRNSGSGANAFLNVQATIRGTGYRSLSGETTQH